MKLLLIATTAAAALTVSACNSSPDVAKTDTVATTDNAMVPGTTPVAATTWDTNNNGMLDQNEYDTYRTNGFSTWDLNGDNQLDQTEFDTGWTNAGFHNGNGLFTDWDANHDNSLEPDEWFSDNSWNTIDSNGNGMLDQNEFNYY